MENKLDSVQIHGLNQHQFNNDKFKRIVDESNPKSVEANKAYEEAREIYEKNAPLVDEVIKKNKKSGNIIPLDSLDVSFTLNENDAKAYESIQKYRKAKQSIIFDMEVIGHTDAPDTFAVTQLAVQVMNNETGDITETMNLELGLPPMTDPFSKELFQNYSDYINGGDIVEEVRGTEKVRVSKFTPEQVKGFDIIKTRTSHILGKEEGEVITDEDHLNALRKLIHQDGPNYDSKDTSTMSRLMEIRDRVNEVMGPDDIIISHNGDASDVIWSNKLFGLFGEEFAKTSPFTEANNVDSLKIGKAITSRTYTSEIGENRTVSGFAAAVRHDMEGKAHEGTADTTALGRGLYDPVDESGRTIVDIAEAEIEKKIATNSEKSFTLKTGDYLYSTTSLNFKGGFDARINNHTENIEMYRDYQASRNMFYEVGDITHIENANLPEELQEYYANGMFSVDIASVENTLDAHTVTVTRGSMEELNSVLANNFSHYERGVIPIEDAYAQADNYHMDRARKEFNDFFTVEKGKGFDKARFYYGALNNADREAVSQIGRKLTKDELVKLAHSGELTVGENKVTRDSILKDFYYKAGNTDNVIFNTSKFTKFEYMYNTLSNTEETVGAAIRRIEKVGMNGSPEAVNAQRTKLFKNAYEDIVKAANTVVANSSGIGSNELDVEFDKRNREYYRRAYQNVYGDNLDEVALKGENIMSDFSRLNYVAVDDLDGGLKNISTNSIDTISIGLHGIKNAHKKAYEYEGSTAINDEVDSVRKMAQDLHNRGVIKEDTYGYIMEHNNAHNSIQRMAEDIMTEKEDILKNISPERLLKKESLNLYDNIRSSSVREYTHFYNDERTLSMKKQYDEILKNTGFESKDGVIADIAFDEIEYIDRFHKLNPTYRKGLYDGTFYDVREDMTYSLDDLYKLRSEEINNVVFNGGAPINGQSPVNAIISNHTDGVKSMVFETYAHDKSGNIKGKIGKKKFIEKYKDFFETELNYNEQQIGHFFDSFIKTDYDADMVSGKNRAGLSYAQRGYSTALISERNKYNQQVYSVIGFKAENTDSVVNSLMDGKMPNNVLVRSIPKIETALDGNLKYVSVGSKRSQIVKNIGFGLKQGQGLEDITAMTVYSDDTIGNSLKAERLHIKDNDNRIDRLVKKGQYAKANRMIKRSATKEINEEIGATSPLTIIGENGKLHKGYVENLSDIQTYLKADEVSLLLPYLYNNSEKTRVGIDELFGGDKKAVQNAFQKFEDKARAGAFRHVTYTDLGSELGEHFVKNLFYGDNYVKELSNIFSSMSIEERGKINTGLLDLVEELNTGGYSTLGKSSLFKDGLHLVKGDLFNVTPFSFLSNPRRDQLNQALNTINIYSDEVENLAVMYGENKNTIFKDLEDKGVYMNEVIRTNYVNDNFIKNSYKDNGDRIITGAYMNTKQISTNDMMKKLDGLDPVKIQKELKAKGIDRSIYDIEDTINHYKFLGTTYEQKSFMSPDAYKYAMSKRELRTVRVDKELLENFKEGQEINADTIIYKGRLNGEDTVRKYKGDVGKITHIDFDTGSLHIDVDEKAFEGSKIILSGIEKSMSESIMTSRITGNDITDISSLVFNKIAGDDVSLIANFELGKHESGSIVIANNINDMALDLSRNGSKKDIDTFVERVNKHIKGVNFAVHEDKFYSDKVGEQRYHFTMDASKVEGNAITQLRGFYNEYNKDEKNGDEFAKAFNKRRKQKNKEKIYTVFVQKGMNSETHRTSSSELDASENGVKHTLRESLVFGSQQRADFRENIQGASRRIAEPILDAKEEYIRGTKAYKQAARELNNITYSVALNGLSGGDTEFFKRSDLPLLESAKIASIDFKDVKLPPKKDFTAEVLNETLFGKYKDYDVIEVNLGNHSIFNEITGKNTNKINIPVSMIHVIDDNSLFMTSTNKRSVKLLESINTMIYGESQEIRSFARDEAGKAFIEMNNAALDEMRDKNGIVNKMLTSGRLPLSTSALNYGIIEPSFTDDKGTAINHKLSSQIIDIAEDGTPKYMDTVFVSMDMARRMGPSDQVLVDQLLGGEIGDDKFINQLIEEGLLNADKSLNIMSKSEYMEKIMPMFDEYFEVNKANIVGNELFDSSNMEIMGYEEFIHSDAPEAIEGIGAKLKELEIADNHYLSIGMNERANARNAYGRYKDSVIAQRKDLRDTLRSRESYLEFLYDEDIIDKYLDKSVDRSLTSGRSSLIDDQKKLIDLNENFKVENQGRYRKYKDVLAAEKQVEVDWYNKQYKKIKKKHKPLGKKEWSNKNKKGFNPLITYDKYLEMQKVKEKSAIATLDGQYRDRIRNLEPVSIDQFVKDNDGFKNSEYYTKIEDLKKSIAADSATRREYKKAHEVYIKERVDKELPIQKFDEFIKVNEIGPKYSQELVEAGNKVEQLGDEISAQRRKNYDAYKSMRRSSVKDIRYSQNQIASIKREWLEKNGYNVEVDKLNRMIADSFYINVGVLGTEGRHPMKDAGASYVTRIKANPYLSAKASMQTPWGAAKHHADTDGDTKGIHFLGLTKDENGRTVFRKKNDKIRVAMEKMLEVQSVENAEIVKAFQRGQIYIDGDFKTRGDFNNISMNNFERLMEKANVDEDTRKYLRSEKLKYAASLQDYDHALRQMYSGRDGDKYFTRSGSLKNTNYYTDDEFLKLSVKARHNKGQAIGAVSNLVVKLKNASETMLSKQPEKVAAFDLMIKSFEESEQKLIDVKHLLKDEISASSKFSNAFKRMAEINPAENKKGFDNAFRDYFDAAVRIKSHGDDLGDITVDDIISGKFSDDSNAAKGLRQVYDFMGSSDTRVILNDPFSPFSNIEKHGKQADINKELSLVIGSMLGEGDVHEGTFLGNKIFGAVRDGLKNNFVTVGDVLVGENENAMYKVVKTDLFGERKSIEMEDLSTGDIFTIDRTTDSGEFSDFIKENYTILKGESAKIGEEKLDDMLKTLTQSTVHRRIKSGSGSGLEFIQDAMLRKNGKGIVDDGILTQNDWDGYTERVRNANLGASFEELGTPQKRAAQAYANAVVGTANALSKDQLESFHVANKAIVDAGHVGQEARMMSEKFYDDIMKRGKAAQLSRAEKEKEFMDSVKNQARGMAETRKVGDKIVKEGATGEVYNTRGLVDDAFTMRDRIATELIEEADANLVNKTYEKAIAKGFTELESKNFESIKKNSLAYAKAYESNKGYNAGGLNWNATVEDILRSDINVSLDDLGASKVGYGLLANARLDQLSLEDLKRAAEFDMSSILNDLNDSQAESLKKMIEESRKRIEKYIEISLSSSRAKYGHGIYNDLRNKITDESIYSSAELINTDKINETIIKKGKRAQAIREAAEKANRAAEAEKINRSLNSSDDIMRSSALKKLLKNKYVLGATAIGATAIGLSSMSAYNKHLNPAMVDPEGENYRARNEELGNGSSNRYQAPKSTANNRSVLEGLSMKIRGKGNVSKDEIYKGIDTGIKRVSGNDVNINTHEKDNSRDISSRELEREVSKLIR